MESREASRERDDQLDDQVDQLLAGSNAAGQPRSSEQKVASEFVRLATEESPRLSAAGRTQGMNALREYAAKAGRDMRTISVSVFGVAADPKLIGMYQDAEVTRIILLLPSECRETILPLLDQYITFLR